MRPTPIWIAILMSATTSAQEPSLVDIPDHGWRLWLDREATWENDTVYLPGEADLETLPVRPPTGGWETLDRVDAKAVTLPSTVEQHFWGMAGVRSYSGEYFYEKQDTAVLNGNYRGVSWWWRDVDVPSAFDGKMMRLFIRGARLRAEVFWNGQLVGYNCITEVSFTCDVTRAAVPGGKNRLAIRITNPGGRLDWLDTELMTWGAVAFHKSHGFGGLDRGMVLRAHEPVFIEDLWALNTPEVRTLVGHVRVASHAPRTSQVRVRWDLTEVAGDGTVLASAERAHTLAAGATAQLSSPVSLSRAELWSPKSPKLYTLRATLIATCVGRESMPSMEWHDTGTTTTGFRWFEADGIGRNAVLRLNGERVRLYSAISWGFWGLNGLWPTRELAEREILAAKELGLNTLQFHRNVGKAEVLEFQDELGLLRYMEPGGGQTSLGQVFSLYAPSPIGAVDASGAGGDAATFAERYMEEKITRMIRDHRRHPSLILWCLQNEIHPDLHNPRVFRILRRMRQEDPSRIVVLKSGFPSGRPSVNQAWMQPYSESVHFDTGDGVSGWWDDHTVGGPGVWRDDMYRGPHEFTHRSTNDSEIVMWGEMLGAAAPDNHARMVRSIEARAQTSYDLQDHKDILAGYEQFLDRWGFRASFPTSDALFESIGNKSYDFWGRVLETARLGESSDYFVVSGWESTSIENHSGLVDNLRNFKGTPSLIGERLSPLRVVIKCRSLAVGPGEDITVDLFLLNETRRAHARKMDLWLESPAGQRRRVGTYRVPPRRNDRFVYPVATGLRVRAPETEGTLAIAAALAGADGASARERVLVVGSRPDRPLPSRIGLVSTHPSLAESFEMVPGVRCERLRPGITYDLMIAADRLILPPSAETEPDRAIRGTRDPELFRSIHFGTPENFDYVFPGLPEGNATVTLFFVEAFQNAPGVRVFDVAINDSTVLKDFDVWAEAGGKDIAIRRAFTLPVVRNTVRITVPRVAAGTARFAAIRIDAGDTVVAVNCGGRAYRDSSGLTWTPYAPACALLPDVLERVQTGTPLLLLAEGEMTADAYARRLAEAGAFRYLGVVGEARASWMGSWYFVRDHPVYKGLPTACAMGSEYQVPVANSCGVLVEGDTLEVFAGYSRDHDRRVAAAGFTARLGRGRLMFHTVPGGAAALRGASAGMHPLLMRRLILNSLAYLL